jgi:hypothetical protein
MQGLCGSASRPAPARDEMVVVIGPEGEGGGNQDVE